ncbi:ABC transporter permease [Streptomyces sp. NPDC050263]|uniref:ABC transporter permease n=1 Tax=Streptomyces sp. NPDC050263 TaxID=3155037 RepID=UPI003431C640
MTALTLGSDRTAPAAKRTPAPGTHWLLRLHRPAFHGWIGVVAVLGLALIWLWGPLTDSAIQGWRQYNACDYDAGPCAYDQNAIVRYKSVYMYTTGALTALPFVVAAWAGASLFGRELEHGTAQLAWTQGLSPVRWLATKLAVPAVLVAAGTGLLVTLHRLTWSAGDGRIDTAKNWHDSLTLHTNGPTTVALALTGLTAGALAGLLLRRTLPALMLALGFVAALRVLADLAMPHLWPTFTKVTSLGDAHRSDGMQVDSGLVTSSGAHVADPGCGPASSSDTCAALYKKLDATGFYSSYHPESHYWPLQLTTTALVLAVAAALAVAAFVLIRRTTATTPRVAQEAAV